ncbi:hypothetical protein HZB69_00255 [Candidatus Amesbacteria bacterium]|nr:hypothetical protein [Candidatus Amesbacteria bacterium]
MLDVSQYHLRLVKDYGSVTVWEIDGAKLRAEKDIEFSNFGMYPDFDYIPKNELWLDHECHPDEHRFFIDHMLAQWKALKHGYTKEQAIKKAYQAEKSERAKSKDQEKVESSRDVHIKKYGETKNGLVIWVVNGRLVRSDYFIDFVEGGHHLIYPWVPEKEVWLDDDLKPSEFPFVLLHELHERSLMAKGWTYDKAHTDSSKIEFYCHHHPAKLSIHLLQLGFHS